MRPSATWTQAPRPDRIVCTQAERFAAAVLMQPRAFEPLALEWGLDVLKLQRAVQCSYASVTIRLAEVLRQPPFMAALYAREDKSDPAGWTDPLDLRAKVVRRTRGFGTPATFPICGERGGFCPAGAGPSPQAPWQSRPPATARRATPTTAVRRHSQARHQEWQAGEGRGHRRARKLRLRPRSPDGRLGHAGAQAQAGGGWPLVGVAGQCPDSV